MYSATIFPLFLHGELNDMIKFLTFGIKTHRCNAVISGYYTPNALQTNTTNSGIALFRSKQALMIRHRRCIARIDN